MSEQEQWIPSDDRAAVELHVAVHAGDVAAVERLLRANPTLATARLGGPRDGSVTALHLPTDWPGYFPNGRQIVRLLIDAGADPNASTARHQTGERHLLAARARGPHRRLILGIRTVESRVSNFFTKLGRYCRQRTIPERSC